MFVSKKKYNDLADWSRSLAEKNYLLELEIKQLKKPAKKSVAKKTTVKKESK